MKKALLTIFAAWLAAFCVSAQTTILDFETPATSTVFQYFGSSLEGTFTQNVANPAPGGINTSATVSNFIKPAGAQTWAGAFSSPNPTTPINATGGALIKIKVRMDHIGNLALKLEQSTTGQPNWIRTVSNTQVNTWEELVFDCSLPSIEAPNQAATGVYQRVVLFFDFGSGGGGADVLSHFDDLVVEGAPPPPSYPVDFSVDMSQYGGSFNTVYVSGGFNGWSGNANPLSDADGDDIWTGTINLPPGNYEYKFTLDNWAAQEQFTPGMPCTVTNGGFTNRSLAVSGNTTLPEYCWNSCSVCSPATNTIDFSVDMSQYAPNFTTVYISGNFNGWSGNANPLSDPDGDEIWTTSLNLAAGTYEYKFTIDNWAAQEQFVPGEPCTMTTGGFTNRVLTVAGNATLPEYCWNSCSVCGIPNPMVNFSVNMNDYSGGFTQVYLSGNFNGWSGNANAMSDPDGDNVWEASISMPAGNYEYKVTLDNWAGQEQFLGTETCTFTTGPFTNRTLTVPSGGVTIPEFCFNSCYACGDEVVMTFQLGKGFAVPHPEGFWLAGGADFGAPNSNKYKMKDPDGDGIYTIVVPRQVGYSTYFTFTNGPCPDFSCKENIAGLPCANPNNYNDRFMPAVNADMTYASCFGQCSDNAQCTYPALMPVFTTTDVLCNGGNNGAINTTVTGGSTIYTYNWGGGITTKNRSNLTAGTYTVTITDAIAQQTVIQSVVINQPAVLVPAAATTNVLCFGAANGTITLSASGGTPNYSYNWGGGMTGATRTGLAPGVYTATVTDANACTKTISTTISQPTVLAATSTSVNVDCFGNSTGSINLNPTGGTVNYNFAWNDGNNTQNRTGLPAGTYSVTVTDANNCTTVHSKNISQPSELFAGATTFDVDCFGDASGAIFLSATGGTAGYQFLWDDGTTNSNRTGLPIGTYSATVTDANACAKIISRTIEQPEAPLSAAANVDNVNCFGETTGAIELEVEGGTAGYSFQWSGTTATTQEVYDLPAGEYFVTVTDANDCTLTLTEIILEPSAALAVSSNVSHPTCGNANGSISLDVNGGTAPYFYNWNDGSTSKNRTGLAAGTYTVVVSDFFDCTQTLTSVVNPSTSQISLAAAAANVACFGGATGSINLTVNAGAAPFNFNWSNGSTTQNLVGLPVGTYTATVTDNSNCTSTVSQTISEPASALSVAATAAQIGCFGEATGSVELQVSGGTAGYNFNWSNGSTAQNLTGLTAGNYSATVADANGCTFSISQNISQPNAALTASALTNDVECFGGATGSITLGASGGTPNFSFNWNTGSTAQNLTGLTAGNYSATISDANGCTTTIERSISQPASAVAASATATDAACFGEANGTASISASGGTGAFSFVWANGETSQNIAGLAAGNYFATVSDAENCTTTVSVNVAQPSVLGCTATATAQTANNLNDGTATAQVSGGTTPYIYVWSNGATDASLSNLAPGTYAVVVTDANGCSTEQTVTVNSFNCALSANISGTNISCFGANDGTAAINLQGGSQPIQFNWSNGATTSSIAGLAAGNYLVEILDANGCPAAASVIISEPTALNVNASATAPTANNLNDGTATANPTGGTAPYNFEWSNGSNSQTINDLAPGTYAVTATDANGCSAVQNVVVSTFGCALQADFTTQNVSCAGAADGQIAVNPTGGAAPYTFSWSNGQTTATATGLSGGSYAVNIEDALGCETIVSATISEPTALNATIFNQTNVVCPDDATGSATLATTGGTAPHTFLWSNGSTDATATGLSPNIYAVVVTDANGCTATAQANIVAIDNVVPQVTCPANIVRCSDDNKVDYPAPSAADNCATTGGTWNIAAGQPSGSTFLQGTTTQIFTFTDASGNVGSCSFEVRILSPVAVAAPVVTDDKNSQSIGAINISAQGGLPPYSFNWTKNGSPFATTEDLSNLSEGSYSVVVTDANGCIVAVQNIAVGNLVAAHEPDWASGLKMSPNPTSGQVQLVFAEILKSELEISVLDAVGRVVFQNISTGKQVIDLQLSHLPEGIYAVRMRSAGEVGVRVLVVQR